MIKILATSDLHGNLPNIVEPFDLLILAGDICPATNHNIDFQHDWATSVFVDWLNNLPYKDANSKVVMIWGNHDFWAEADEFSSYGIEDLTKHKVKVLQNTAYEFEYPVSDGLDNLKIFGTPYCSVFYNWAFMIPDDKLEEKFSEIPENTDILISHDSPNIYKLGAIQEGPYKSDTTGNKVLPKHLERVKPMMYFCGHFHSGNHDFEERNGTWMANVSYVNERYKPVNPILSIDYDEENRKIIGHEYLKA